MSWPEAFVFAIGIIAVVWLLSRLARIPPREPYQPYQLPQSRAFKAWPWPRASERSAAIRRSADRAMAEIMAGREDKGTAPAGEAKEG